VPRQDPAFSQPVRRASAVADGIAAALESGRLKYELKGALVRLTDTETGEQLDKQFTSPERASAWVT